MSWPRSCAQRMGLGVKVAAHAHGLNGIKAALKAGVDSIDHGTFSDAEAMKLFKQSSAYLVPTLSPGVKAPATMEGNPFFTDAFKVKANAVSTASPTMFQDAYKFVMMVEAACRLQMRFEPQPSPALNYWGSKTNLAPCTEAG